MQDWMEILIRSAALFFIVFVLIRLIGKRHPSRVTPFNYVVFTVMSLIAALISVNIIKNIVFGLLALGTWAAFALLLDYLALKSKAVHDLVNGKETVLIKQGKIMEENLKRARLTGEELLRELRRKNIFNLSDVEFALLEATGEINAMLKSDKVPVTPHHLEWKVALISGPQTVISDGNILDQPLANIGLNRQWVLTELEKAGVALENVFLGQVDSYGDLYLDLFDDAVQLPQAKVKDLLYAALEKSRADLQPFPLKRRTTRQRPCTKKMPTG